MTTTVEKTKINAEALISAEALINAEMPIGDVVKKYPQTIQVFLRHGLVCVGCAVARFENIRDGAAAHGIDVDALMNDLNQAVA